MKTLSIDYSGRRPPPPAWTLFLLAIGAILCISAGWRVGTENGLQTKVSADVARVNRLLIARRPAPEQVAELPEAQVEAINKAILQLNLPWQALFKSIERVKPPNVALLGLEPDGNKRMLRIQAETKEAPQMLDFVQLLREQPQFSDAVLVKHQINTQDPNQPVRFSIEVVWKESL